MLAIFPEISAAVQSGNLEQISILARRYFASGSWSAPCIDVARLVKESGIPIVRLRLKEYGAIALRDEKGSIQCSIAIRDDLSAEDEAFLLAHLIGHYLLHIQPKLARTEWTASGFKEAILPSSRYAGGLTSSASATDPMEDAADRFAAALLMPAAMLIKAVETLKDEHKVARLFGVSHTVIARRLLDLTSISHDANTQELPKASMPKIEIRPAARNRPAAESTANMLRERHHQAAPTPRALAAQSYSVHKGEEAPAEEAPTIGPSGKGMNRLREIARMLDKSNR
jgi:Zn-dependent peptidase ImmA (M78 family)